METIVMNIFGLACGLVGVIFNILVERKVWAIVFVLLVVANAFFIGLNIK